MKSSDRRRLALLAFWAGALVFALLCVPAITRVTQQLGHGSSIAQTSGFSRHGNCPPERVRIARADLPRFDWHAALAVVLAPQAVVPARQDDAPPSEARSAPRPLRAPPAPVSL